MYDLMFVHNYLRAYLFTHFIISVACSKMQQLGTSGPSNSDKVILIKIFKPHSAVKISLNIVDLEQTESNSIKLITFGNR